MSDAAGKLVLGGHSFIRQLGSDPWLDEEGQVRLVETCLNAGVKWFDTTYQPERVALGRALRKLGRREEAVIVAWNFFTEFDGSGEGPVGGADFYRMERLVKMLEELQTDRIDCLVVHAMGNEEGDAAQEELAAEWKRRGVVGGLGMWKLGPRESKGVYDFVVMPRNVTTLEETEVAIAKAKGMGLKVMACSPFVRGWELEKRVKAAREKWGMEEAEARGKLAEMMVRHSLGGVGVDKLIVAMRRSEWVAKNVAAAEKGALNADDRAWLEGLKGC